MVRFHFFFVINERERNKTMCQKINNVNSTPNCLNVKHEEGGYIEAELAS